MHTKHVLMIATLLTAPLVVATAASAHNGPWDRTCHFSDSMIDAPGDLEPSPAAYMASVDPFCLQGLENGDTVGFHNDDPVRNRMVTIHRLSVSDSLVVSTLAYQECLSPGTLSVSHTTVTGAVFGVTGDLVVWSLGCSTTQAQVTPWPVAQPTLDIAKDVIESLPEGNVEDVAEVGEEDIFHDDEISCGGGKILTGLAIQPEGQLCAGEKTLVVCVKLDPNDPWTCVGVFKGHLGTFTVKDNPTTGGPEIEWIAGPYATEQAVSVPINSGT